MNPVNHDDQKADEAWCRQRRAEVVACLQREGLEHGRVGEFPAWHIAPYVSIWAIESLAAPDKVGWWVICGDLPTDYISSTNAKTPRQATSQIARAWLEAAALMTAGVKPAGITIGSVEERPRLGSLLKTRAELLLSWTEDEDVWVK